MCVCVCVCEREIMVVFLLVSAGIGVLSGFLGSFLSDVAHNNMEKNTQSFNHDARRRIYHSIDSLSSLGTVSFGMTYTLTIDPPRKFYLQFEPFSTTDNKQGTREIQKSPFTEEGVNPLISCEVKIHGARFGDPITIRMINAQSDEEVAPSLVLIPSQIYEAGDGDKVMLRRFNSEYAVMLSLHWKSEDSHGPTSDDLAL